MPEKTLPPELPDGPAPNQADGTIRLDAPPSADGDATLIASQATLLQSASDPAASRVAATGDGELPVGYRLEQFEVREHLGHGGFSVVYKVYDHRLQTFRALKEYMPRGFAVRGPGVQVAPRSRHDEEVFRIGLRSFVAEGVTLAKFDHPSLVRVYQNIDANGTAYMVMQLVQGRTLESVVDAMSAPPDEAWLLDLLDPLTAALAVVHDAGIVHRDIKPENVMLLEGTGRPLLLDFGAARQVIDRAGAPTGILTPGYAPLEQYPDSGLQQGPWTDIYALAGTVHRLLTGVAPANALARQMKDSLSPLATRLAGRYSDRFLRALDRALTVDPQKRPRSIAEFRRELGIAQTPLGQEGPRLSRQVEKVGKGMPALAWAGLAVLGLIVTAAVVYYALGRESAPPAVATAPTGASLPPAAPPGTAPSPPAPVAPVQPPTAVAPSPAAIVEPEAAFDQIVQGSSPGFTVKLAIERAELRVNVSPLRLRLTSARPGWYYVLVHDTDGEVRLLFPATGQTGNRIRPNETVSLPPRVVDPATGIESAENMPFGEPTGPARLLAIVSDTPLDYAVMTQREEGGFPVLLKGAESARAAAAQPNGRALYLGALRCPPGNVCAGQYGAASVGFRVVP